MSSITSTRASSPEMLSYPPSGASSPSSTCYSPEPLRTLSHLRLIPEPLNYSPESGPLLFPMDMDPISEITIQSTIGPYPSPPSSPPQLGRRTIPLPAIPAPKPLHALNATMSSMAGIRHSFGAKVRDGVKEAEAFTLTFFDQFFQHPIGQALREAQKKTEDTLEQWFQDQVPDGDQSPGKDRFIDPSPIQMMTPPSSPATSSPPSYRTRSTSDPECPGPEWERTPVWFENDGSEFLIPDEQGRLTHAHYVKYDLTPSYPTRTVTLGKDRPVYTSLLRPMKAKTPASPYDAVKRRLFDQEEPFLNWVEEALKVEDDRSLTAGMYNYCYQCRQIATTERLMNQVAKNLGMYVDHKMEALCDLEAADAFNRIVNNIAWSDHLNLPSHESEAYEAYRQVTRVRYEDPKPVRVASRHSSLPHSHHRCLRYHPYAPQPARKSGRKRCHRCHKWGHIRAQCPTKLRGYM